MNRPKKNLQSSIPVEKSPTKEKALVELERNNTTLKRIFRRAETSGKDAWKAGKILWNIKKGKLFNPPYQTFPKYVHAEFPKVIQTAYLYMKIKSSFKISEVGTLILSVLKVIANVEDDELRKEIVNAIKENKKGKIDLGALVATIAHLQRIGGRFSKGTIIDIFRKYAQKNKEVKEKEKKIRKTEGKFGRPLVCPLYPDIADVLLREPISEMGVVAIFCLLMKHLRGIPFRLDDKRFSFNAIKFLRTQFPDACVECKIHGRKNEFREIFIEFEYRSKSFDEHISHPKYKECHMIICWEDNSEEEKDALEFPPILELKNFLETGKMKLIYSKRPTTKNQLFDT
jgi:hypothetical protein